MSDTSHLASTSMKRLLKDREDSVVDATYCQMSMNRGVFIYERGSVLGRYLDNVKIIGIIDDELNRRAGLN